eukprot:144053-Hanusia_phi.AAC.6
MWSPKTTATWSFGPKYRAWQPKGEQSLFESEVDYVDHERVTNCSVAHCLQSDLTRGCTQFPTYRGIKPFLTSSTQSSLVGGADHQEEGHLERSPWHSVYHAINPQQDPPDEFILSPSSYISNPVLHGMQPQAENQTFPYFPLNRDWNAGIASPLRISEQTAPSGGRALHEIQPAGTHYDFPNPIKTPFKATIQERLFLEQSHNNTCGIRKTLDRSGEEMDCSDHSSSNYVVHLDEMELFAGINALCLNQSDPSPSPMPPKPKITVQNPDVRTRTIEEERFAQTCDAVVARAIVSIVNSFGNGPLEQGRYSFPFDNSACLRHHATGSGMHSAKRSS